MKLKSYLRGIGAGMIVAALVMGASIPKDKAPDVYKNETLKESVKKDNDTSEVKDNPQIVASVDVKDNLSSDEILPGNDENIVSEGSLEGVTDNNKAIEPEKENPSEEEIKNQEEKPEDPKKEEPKQEEPKQEEPKKEEPETQTPDSLPKQEFTGETFTLKVISGDDSVSVSRRLYEAGLIESVSSFDDYLCEHRYDRFIGVGFYDIPAGADYETMAKIITRRYYGE